METTAVSSASQFVVGWVSLAFIIAGIAQGKNRDGMIWFLVGACFGPFALGLLVIFFDKLPEKSRI